MSYLRTGLLHHHGNPPSAVRRASEIWLSSSDWPAPLEKGRLMPIHQITGLYPKDVVSNFLRWIPEHEEVKRQLALDVALLSRPFNQDDLISFTYLPENDRSALFRWLTEQHFVIRTEDGPYRYYDTQQVLFSRHLKQLSPSECEKNRRALVDHYQRMLEKIEKEDNNKAYSSAEWLELVLALAYQLPLLPDESSHISAATAVQGKVEPSDKLKEGV